MAPRSEPPRGPGVPTRPLGRMGASGPAASSRSYGGGGGGVADGGRQFQRSGHGPSSYPYKARKFSAAHPGSCLGAVGDGILPPPPPLPGCGSPSSHIRIFFHSYLLRLPPGGSLPIMMQVSPFLPHLPI